MDSTLPTNSEIIDDLVNSGSYTVSFRPLDDETPHYYRMMVLRPDKPSMEVLEFPVGEQEYRKYRHTREVRG